MEIVEVGECTEIGEEPEEVYTHIVASSTSGVHMCVFAYVCIVWGGGYRDVMMLTAFLTINFMVFLCLEDTCI